MATNYPGAVDSLTNPGAGDGLDSPSHSAQHANANDAIEAVQTELGTDPSGSAATVKARFEAIEANDWVTSARIAADAVGTSEIAANAVGSSELADGAVDTAAIQASAVTTAKVADGAVTPAKLATSGRFTFPTGAANGYGFTSGASHLSGTGTPEGVVTAAPGSTWLQTDATTDVKGWIRWVKATGTGNTGWVAGPEADTGQRDISASLLNSWTTTSNVYIRRIGNMVELYGAIRNAAGAASSNEFLAQITGFNSVSSAALTWAFNSGTGTASNAVRSGGGNYTLIGSRPSDQNLFFTLIYPTAQTWPASLPGSAA